MPAPDVAERSPPMRPGAMQLTVMPCGANSADSDLVNPTMPVLAAPTWARAGVPRWLDTPPRLMMRPHLFLTMCGSTAREQKNEPSSTTSSTDAPFLVTHLEERLFAADGGVVDEDVDPAELADHGVDHGLDRGLLGDVGDMHHRLGAGGLDLLGGLLGLVARGPRIDDDRRAVAGERQRHRPCPAAARRR